MNQRVKIVLRLCFGCSKTPVAALQSSKCPVCKVCKGVKVIKPQGLSVINGRILRQAG